jgi:cytochrome c-type biogenesis protein CcmH
MSTDPIVSGSTTNSANNSTTNGGARSTASSSPLRVWGPWVLLVVVVVAVLSVATFTSRSSPTAADRVNNISLTIKCPVCAGESVAVSNAPASLEIRKEIAEQVQQSQTDEQIRSYYAAKYGEAILLTPSASGINALVWILPVVALALAIAGLAIAFRRWSVAPTARATDADRELVASAMSGDASNAHVEAEPIDDEHGEGNSR